jgi:mannose-1-phosphate guanylyltransferase
MAEKNKNTRIGILLAAGYGTRLRPLTLVKPKPLVPLFGIPLLEIAIRQMSSAGFSLIAVNGGWLGEQIAAYLSLRQDAFPGTKFRYFDEPKVLGVAGGMRRMLKELPAGDVLIQNADILHSIDLNAIMNGHENSKAFATLVGAGSPLAMQVDADRVCGLGKTVDSTHGFSGIHVLSENCRQKLYDWEKSAIVPFYNELIAAGSPIRADVFDSGYLWQDIGHLQYYHSVHCELWENSEFLNLASNLELDLYWDPDSKVSMSPSSNINGQVGNSIIWPGVSWSGNCRDSLILQDVCGKGTLNKEIVL